MINVHLFWVGSVNSVYLAAGIVFSPATRSDVVKKAVALSAPVRHTSLNGTKSPKILRPRMRGLEYATLIVFPSANLHAALAGGLRTSWLWLGIAKTIRPKRITKQKAEVFLTISP